jgi:hypothetical protein
MRKRRPSNHRKGEVEKKEWIFMYFTNEQKAYHF